ncbi:MAG: hypothetical protein NT154_44970 [Verrucomicrobia bacterium]|nr:hypothetical protein [Verrucomicrobiota bacterium]
MRYLLTSDLKQRTAKVLAAALKKPQFVFRNGEVFVIRRVVLTMSRIRVEGIWPVWSRILGTNSARLLRLTMTSFKRGDIVIVDLDAVLETLCRILGAESKHLAP